MDTQTAALVAALLILVFLSGFFSCSEIALFSLSFPKIKAYQSDPNPRKRLIAKLVLQPRDLLVTVFMMNTLVNILLQNVASSTFGDDAGWELKVGVPLILTLLFGEVIPKNIGLENNISISYYVAPWIDKCQRFLEPVRRLIIAVTAPISKAMFFYLKKEESISKEELQHVLKKSEEYGVMQQEEAELVWGYLNLQDSQVKEIMWPREDMLVYEISEPLSKLEYLFIDKGRTRLPVMDKNLDNILGILEARTFFINRHRVAKGSDLAPLLEKPFYIPETSFAKTLLKRLQENGEVLALAVDEYGSVTGLITKEDLSELVIEKVVETKENPMYTKSRDNEIITNGKLELADFNEIFGANLTSPNNMVTIGGWLTEYIGDIPKAGTKCEAHGFLFQVLAADPNRIRRLYIRKLGKNHTEGSNHGNRVAST